MEFCPCGNKLLNLYLMDPIEALVARTCYCRKCSKYYFVCEICGIKEPDQYPGSNDTYSHIVSKHGGVNENFTPVGDGEGPHHIMYLVFDVALHRNLMNKLHGECLNKALRYMSENSYKCVFCQYYDDASTYDCFPSKDIVVKHLSTCIPRLKTQNQLNNIAYIKGDI